VTEAFVRSDEGQALVVVGIALAVIVGALVLTADWGYGLATRRAAQNQADAAALAAGRVLASSYDGASPAFATTQEDAWNAACEARNANTPNAPVSQDRILTVSFLASDGAQIAETSSASPTCTLTPAVLVPNDTSEVRVRSEMTYQSLLGVVTRQQISVAASAQARLTSGAAVRPLRVPNDTVHPVGTAGVGLSGASTLPNSAMWPIVVRYNVSSWDPSGSRVISLIGSGAASPGVQFLAISHYSPHEAIVGRSQSHQTVTESDYTGTSNGHHGHPSTPRLANSDTRACGGSASWDTNGDASLATAATCDVPNWFNYGYRGSLSVGTNWNDASWGQFEGAQDETELPDPLSLSRASCTARAASFYNAAPPSCVLATAGDWVETTTGIDPSVVADRMLSFISRYGRDVPMAGGGLEKAVVVNVFLWDCGETFVTAAPEPPRDRWRPITGGGGDCSLGTGAFDRVHLFTAVPLTFRESDVVPSTNPTAVNVSARWGHVFGDAGQCAYPSTPAGCELNPMINSAFLVPDE